MRPTITTAILFALFSITADAQVANNDLSLSLSITDPVAATQSATQKRKLNFFVISKRKKGKLDLATRFNVFRTRIKGLFRKKRFKSIIAADAQEASDKIRSRLNNKNGRIGTLWFDSHGMYKKGHSVFFIGKDEFSYRTLKDTCHDNAFEQLAVYTDHETNIVIGSCYGGATYDRMSVDYKDTTRMNGDSLMIALGNIFSKASIYASESWVMTKPGLFRKKAAVAGFPGGKLYRDICYQPAWENVGKWNQYNANTKSFSKVNPVTLNRNGSLMLLKKSYTEKDEVKSDIMKKLEKLEPGLYK
jgi:hypothetical protein